MPKKKTSPRKKPAIRKSKPSSTMKKSSPVSTPKKGKKSKSSAKSSRGDSSSAVFGKQGEFSRQHRIIPIDAKGKEVKRPKGKEVFYGIQGPKGGIQKIKSQHAQKFTKKDLQSLNQILKKTGSKNFVIYEEQAKEAVRKGGKIQYRTKDGRLEYDKKGKPIPIKKIKITGASAKKKQRPVLFEQGQRVRELDLGFRPRTARERVDAQLLTMVEPQAKGGPKFTKEIFLTGKTIRETVKNLHVPISIKDMKRQGLTGLDVETEIKFYGIAMDPVTSYARVETLANFTSDVSRAIRFKLCDHGYRFTSLVELTRIYEKVLANDAQAHLAPKILKVGKLRRKVVDLLPIFPEKNGSPIWPKSSKQSPRVSIRLNITGF